MAIFGVDFLTAPEAFPVDIGGKPWGEIVLTLDIAGGPYRIDGLTQTQSDVLRSRFAHAIVPDSRTPSLSISLFQARFDAFRDPPATAEPRNLETRPLADSIQVTGYHFLALLQWHHKLAAGMWTCESEDLAFRLAFENFFRLVVAYRLVAMDALLVHAAGVVTDGRADIFVGRSGYGKSTISRFSRDGGGSVLSDDMVGLSVSDKGLYVFPLPFAGELDMWPNCDDRFPVRSLLWLSKGEHHHLAAMSLGHAVSKLLICAPYVNTDLYRTEQVVANAARCAEAVPSFTLTFAKDKGFRLLLDHALD